MKGIATHARCSIGVVSKVLCLYQKYGEVKDPFRQYTGRLLKLRKADLRFIAHHRMWCREGKGNLSIAHLSKFICSAASYSTNFSRHSSTRVANNGIKERINSEDVVRTAYLWFDLLCLAVGNLTWAHAKKSWVSQNYANGSNSLNRSIYWYPHPSIALPDITASYILDSWWLCGGQGDIKYAFKIQYSCITYSRNICFEFSSLQSRCLNPCCLAPLFQ